MLVLQPGSCETIGFTLVLGLGGCETIGFTMVWRPPGREGTGTLVFSDKGFGGAGGDL
jgi:hypothetical protein